MEQDLKKRAQHSLPTEKEPECEKNSQYWDSFYTSQENWKAEPTPSQFAAFVIQEIETCEWVVEFGCGNGRDAVFFERYGKHVVALDGCAQAIAGNLRRKKKLNMRSDFFLFSVGHEVCPKQLFSIQEPKALYARFFLHALNDQERRFFWKLCSVLLKKNECLFLEYRTSKDQGASKVTPEHFRNYLDPTAISKELMGYGLHTCYLREGLGFAKWKNDDAHVARHVVTLNHG